MAWTSPRTWVTGEVVTAGLLNTHIRDEFITLGGAIGTAYAPAAANTDLAAPTNWHHTIAPTGAGFSVRSIAAPAQAGQQLVLRNTSANSVQLLHATAGGTGAQLNLRGAGTVTLVQYDAIELIYDGTTWNEIGRSAAGQGTRLESTATQAIANNTQTAVSYSGVTPDFDDAGQFSNSTPTRLTAKSPGTYLFGGTVLWQDGTGGTERSLRIIKNGNTGGGYARQSLQGTANGQFLHTVGAARLALNDYIELSAYQDSGGSLNILGNGTETNSFWMTKVGS